MALALAWWASLALAVNLLGAWGWVMRLESWRGGFWAALPFGAAAVSGIASARAQAEGKRGWRLLAFCWLLAGGGVWVCIGYVQNSIWIFYGAIVVLVAALAGARRALRLGGFGTQVVNTMILLLVAIPVLDRAFDKKYEANREDARGRAIISAAQAPLYYSFKAAHGDPSVFAIWWNFWMREMNHFLARACEPAPGFRPPIRLRPHGTAKLMDCAIAINGLGFRGREIAESKGDHYRIVALGESTTFGMTINPGEKPWPELLEEMIRERLKLSRPVEVINAGMPAYDLENNLRRIERDILPLKPDLIISYHGYNGFPLLDRSFPRLVDSPPPAFPNRPLRLGAALEYRLELRARLAEQVGLAARVPKELEPLQTPYASAYRELIRLAQTNHIRLALANFAMAVDDRSSPAEIQFYGSCGWGEVCARWHANAIHSEIVRELTAANPGILFVDAQPGLEGNPEMFVDVVHLTQPGRQQLAENMFRAIRPTLERVLQAPENRR